MNYHFSAHLQIRTHLLEMLQQNSIKDLCFIPNGYNNNIFWNIAHCVATQQLLHYYLSGNAFRIDSYWVESFKKGSLPKLQITSSEVEDLGFLLLETSKILMKDYDDHLFEEYTTYTTSFGLDLRNIQDGIIFNNIHESLHYGYILAQKRAAIGKIYM